MNNKLNSNVKTKYHFKYFTLYKTNKGFVFKIRIPFLLL